MPREKSVRWLKPMRSFTRPFLTDCVGGISACCNKRRRSLASPASTRCLCMSLRRTYLNGLAKWHADERMGGLAEMRQGWTLLHENDCYLCEPFWGMQVAVANAEAGQLETGLEILRELIVWAEQTGQHWLDAELYRVLGELLSRRCPSDVSTAEDAFYRSLEIARSQQTKTFELRGAWTCAPVHHKRPSGGGVQGAGAKSSSISTGDKISLKSKRREGCSSMGVRGAE